MLFISQSPACLPTQLQSWKLGGAFGLTLSSHPGHLGVKETSRREPMLANSSAVGPQINIGAGLEEAFPGSLHNRQMEASAMQEVYEHQQYWLVWKGGKGQAVLAEGFEPRDVIQILWQAGLPIVAIC